MCIEIYNEKRKKHVRVFGAKFNNPLKIRNNNLYKVNTVKELLIAWFTNFFQ